ncbi:hypothetical protein DID75_03415 [Candidatus Marinamargulisbacteria bacterium SCGC AG-410-N11]|nr:hypothetical protein DID75_03415 [Candidatus Marinamargulisbacteria bacterium SCGC AG-410-N11]
MKLFQEELDTAINNTNSSMKNIIGELLNEMKLTVSTIESFTTGQLATELSNIPNSSNFFLGGFICNHPLAYINYCGIPLNIFKNCSPNSDNFIKTLVNSIQKKTKADICIATTGQMSHTNNNHKGLAKIGLIVKNVNKIKKFSLHGSKESILYNTSFACLGILHQILKNMSINNRKENKL